MLTHANDEELCFFVGWVGFDPHDECVNLRGNLLSILFVTLCVILLSIA